MMRSTRITVCLGMMVALPGAATAAETATVQSLLRQEFAVAGAMSGRMCLSVLRRLFFNCLAIAADTPPPAYR